MEKRAGVYQTKNTLIFCSYSQTTQGINIFIGPYIHLEINETDENIYQALMKVLKLNQENVKHPTIDEWKNIATNHLAGLKIKSQSLLHKNAIYCSVEENKDGYIFSPTNNAGPRGGYRFISKNKIIPISASPEEIVYSLKETLEISKESSS